MTSAGIALAQAYHRDVVGPILTARWPNLPYAAARLGSGSDVLGFDDELSQDHDWGLRLNVLVPDALVTEVREHLDHELPASYEGWPTRFATTWLPGEQVQIQVDATRDFAVSCVGVDPRDGLDPVTWLSLTGQGVLELVAGEVFHDSAGELRAVREALRWYPDDVWRYVLAADWTRLGEEMPLAGRAGQLGDENGSRVVMARLAHAAMHLGFLLERRWPPYAKWLGRAYDTLSVSVPTRAALAIALGAPTWQVRESGLVAALDALLETQRGLGLPSPEAATEPFWDRPFRTVNAETSALLLSDVTDPAVSRLPAGVGSVEQWADGVPVLRPSRRRFAAARAALDTG